MALEEVALMKRRTRNFARGIDMFTTSLTCDAVATRQKASAWLKSS